MLKIERLNISSKFIRQGKNAVFHMALLLKIFDHFSTGKTRKNGNSADFLVLKKCSKVLKRNIGIVRIVYSSSSNDGRLRPMFGGTFLLESFEVPPITEN